MAVYKSSTNLPFILAEDGFIKSVLLKTKTQISIVLDNIGIYYDAGSESYLEILIKKNIHTIEKKQYIKKIIEILIKNKISKYNQYTQEIKILSKPNDSVLIIDQVENDLSLEYGLSNISTLDLIKETKKLYPEKKIYIKLHPDVISGKKRSSLDILEIEKLCTVLDQVCDPFSLIKNFDYICTRTSQMGFEALLMQKTVHCFGMPFYAGWGLTIDHIDESVIKKRRNVIKTVEEVFEAAYMQYTLYIDDRKTKSINIDQAIEIIKEERKMLSKTGNNVIVAGFSIRKYIELKRFLGPNARLVFMPKLLPDKIQIFLINNFLKTLPLVVWGQYFKNKNLKNKIIRVEDGFVRSNGLGSNFVKPLSWVFDDVGIYYDATSSSLIENMFNTYVCDQIDLNSAEKIIDVIVKQRITKYGLKTKDSQKLKALELLLSNKSLNFINNGKIILIPGQVPTDASLKFGAIGKIKTNLELIQEVRKNNKNAIILYKPHPDIMIGPRKSDKDEILIKQIADVYIKDNIDILSLINIADEIHTLTSLSGFEALIRNKTVHCYGMPFYAGWGLTTDHIIDENIKKRRQKSLTIKELVFVSLDLYPSYVNYDGSIATIEKTINTLIEKK